MSPVTFVVVRFALCDACLLSATVGLPQCMKGILSVDFPSAWAGPFISQVKERLELANTVSIQP